MNFNTRVVDGSITIIEYLEENIDASNVKYFSENIQKCMNNTSLLIFNMSNIKFIDSSGLSALIACLRETKLKNGDFRLCSPQGPVKAMLELVRLHSVFSILDTEELAVSSYA